MELLRDHCPLSLSAGQLVGCWCWWCLLAVPCWCDGCGALWCRAPSRAASLGEAPIEDRRAWPCAQSSSSYRPSSGITRCFYGLDASACVSRGGLWPGLKVRWVTLSSGWTSTRWRAPPANLTAPRMGAQLSPQDRTTTEHSETAAPRLRQSDKLAVGRIKILRRAESRRPPARRPCIEPNE
jgi:hypothetical protein